MDISNLIILQGIVGSTAYGLSTPESDIDRLGCFLLPTAEILGRYGESEIVLTLDEEFPFKIDTKGIVARWQNEGKGDSKVTLKPDIQLHEIGKYIRLATQGNPTASELLWLDEYEVMTWAGEMLVANRHLFLSQQVRARYVGYAWSQVERLLKRGDFDSDLKKRTRKHGRHCARLLIQAEHILRTGELKVRLTDDQAEWCFKQGLKAELYPEQFADAMKQKIEELDVIDTSLPRRPDGGKISQILADVRLRQLEEATT